MMLADRCALREPDVMTSDQVPIGEFAQMARLTVRALRHYQDIDLLHPRRVDRSSGYRFYAIDQLRDASLVAMLRSVDVDIETIRSVLHGTVELATVLDDERARRDEHARQAAAALALLEYVATARPIEPAVVEQTAQTLVGHRIAVDAGDEITVVSSAFDTLFSTLRTAGIGHSGDGVCIIHTMTRERLDLTIGVRTDDAVLLPSGFGRVQVEASTTAVALHHGPIEALTLTHAALAEWIHLHGLEPGGPTRETYLGDLCDQRTEIAVPVRARNA